MVPSCAPRRPKTSAHPGENAGHLKRQVRRIKLSTAVDEFDKCRKPPTPRARSVSARRGHDASRLVVDCHRNGLPFWSASLKRERTFKVTDPGSWCSNASAPSLFLSVGHRIDYCMRIALMFAGLQTSQITANRIGLRDDCQQNHGSCPKPLTVVENRRKRMRLSSRQTPRSRYTLQCGSIHTGGTLACLMQLEQGCYKSGLPIVTRRTRLLVLIARQPGPFIHRLGIGELQPEAHHLFVARLPPADSL
jgi:hypothetical protein